MKQNTISAAFGIAAVLLFPGLLSAATVGYQYDALHRLTQVAYPDGTQIQYSYDPAGNVSQRVVTVVADTDGDGIPDSIDPDDDNDGIADWADPDPLDDSVGLDPVLPASTAASVSHTWKSINHPSGFMSPVVIAGPPTYHGGDPGVVRLRSVTDTGFDLRFQEWDYRQDAGDNYHAVEQIHHLVLQSGRYTMTDGSFWEAGTFDLDGTRVWHAISFELPTFSKAPHLFLTVQTEKDAEAVSVRARNVSASGFEAALFEEESRMPGDGHGFETVGYLAIHSSTGGGLISPDGNDYPYLLQTLKADERWSPVLSHRIKVEEEQSRDGETGHVDETLHVLALGERLFAQQVSHSGGDTTALRRLEPTDDAPMEWGLIRGIDHTWETLPFAKTYTDPVLVAKPVSKNGGDPGVIRIRNLNPDHAELRYHEWNYLNGSHTAREDLFYVVSEVTTDTPHSLGGLTVQAGRLNTNAMGLDDRWANVTFNQVFGELPAVFASVMTYTGSDAVATRIDALGTDGFLIAMDEQENKSPTHVTETLGWVAMDQGGGTTAEGRKLKVFSTLLNDVLTAVSYDDALVPFITGHRHPTVVGDVNTTNDVDPVFLRYKSPTNTQIQLKLTEETSADPETDHSAEDVGIFIGE